MGIFSNPKCPHCGSELEETQYAAPFPEWRCRNCMSKNEDMIKIEKLEERVKKLEAQKQS